MYVVPLYVTVSLFLPGNNSPACRAQHGEVSTCKQEHAESHVE